MQIQGQVGAPVTSYGVGTLPNLRAGQQADLIVSQLHGKNYETNYRYNMYSLIINGHTNQQHDFGDSFLNASIADICYLQPTRFRQEHLADSHEPNVYQWYSYWSKPLEHHSCSADHISCSNNQQHQHHWQHCQHCQQQRCRQRGTHIQQPIIDWSDCNRCAFQDSWWCYIGGFSNW